MFQIRLHKLMNLRRCIFAIALSLLAGSEAAATPFSDLINSHSPVAYWRLNETSGTTAVDEEGVYNGTYVGPVLGQPGPGRNNPGAANFDGTNDYITVGAPTVTGSAITISAWIKADDFGVPDARIFSKKRIWTVLIVVTNPAALTPQESLRVFALDQLFGLKVNLIAATATQASYNAAIALADVVFVPEEALSTDINSKLRSAAIGVVNEESQFADDMGIAASSGVVDRNTIRITNNTHYITSPFANGDLVYLSATQPVTHLEGPYAAGMVTLGETHRNGVFYRPSLTIIDTGGILYGGGTAAGRRVQLPWGGDNFDANYLNGNGQLIGARAINWAAGRTDAAAETSRHFWTLATRTSGGSTYLSFLLKAGGTTTTLNASQGPLTPGQWAFVTAVYDGSKMYLYKDGQEVANVAKTGSIDNGVSVPAWIGDNPEKSAGTASGKPFDGLIDEVAIFGKALSPAEVRALYLVGVARGVRVRKWVEMP